MLNFIQRDQVSRLHPIDGGPDWMEWNFSSILEIV